MPGVMCVTGQQLHSGYMSEHFGDSVGGGGGREDPGYMSEHVGDSVCVWGGGVGVAGRTLAT